MLRAKSTSSRPWVHVVDASLKLEELRAVRGSAEEAIPRHRQLSLYLTHEEGCLNSSPELWTNHSGPKK